MKMFISTKELSYHNLEIIYQNENNLIKQKKEKKSYIINNK